jgi:putative peptide zinc metalloprotease protein
VSAVTPASVFLVSPLTVVEHGADFIVGDAGQGTYVVLPPVGVTAIDLLRAGRSVGAVAAAIAADSGVDLDVADFAESLCELGWARPSAGGPAGPASPADAAGPEAPAVSRVGQARRPWAPLVSGPPAWLVAGMALICCVACFAARPGLWPSSSAAFPLGTPVLSMIALMLAAYALRGLHELCHWLAARAAGVRASIRVSHRLYLLVFETDLTGLLALPRRRRYWPLLIGMGFDTVVLAVVLLLRLSAQAGFWHPAASLANMLAAITLLQVVGICVQFFVFMRTDVYAVLTTAAGCTSLWSVTLLTLRCRLGLASPGHRAELQQAHPRDRAVARWYVWLYAAGMLLAAWFFAAYFAPATVRVVSWVAVTLESAGLDRAAFWEALGFSLLLLSPQALTLWAAGRTMARRRRPSPGASLAGNDQVTAQR